MIVREKNGEFVLVKQHDHGQIAGRIAYHWRERPVPYQSTLLAIHDHDLGWQLLDGTVRINPYTRMPYSFIDMPLEERLPAYRWGIDRVEETDPYAACLCSRHYVSFVENDPGAREFVESERQRQDRLTQRFTADERRSLAANLELLQTCDRISLFLCLNEPGENTFPWYRGGIRAGDVLLRPVWVDRSTLRFEPNPFVSDFRVRIPYARISASGTLLATADLYVDIVI